MNYNNINQNETPAQNALPVQNTLPTEVPNTTQNQATTVQETPVAVSDTPVVAPVNYSFLTVTVVIGVVFLLAGFFEFWKKARLRRQVEKPTLPAEDDGSLCPTCGGTGKVTKTHEVSAPCGHCKKSGIDPCHHCGGTGRYGLGPTVPQTEEEVQSLMKCDYCGGSGTSNPAVACCMCKGKRKEYYTEKYEAPCPTCGGTGKK